MSHAITIRKNGQAEMAYVGQTPWHGLGQKLEAGVDIDAWKISAGMDWKIQRSVVRYVSEREGSPVMSMPDKHVLFRSDTKAPLGLVSEKYKVVQPQAVLEFFRDLTDANGFTLDTAGTLFDGKQFWALASIGESACVIGEDRVDGYLLFSSSCDGSMKSKARFTTQRVVCKNTLAMALNGATRGEIEVSHRSVFVAESVKQQLGLARDHFGDFMKAARKLAVVAVDQTQAGAVVASLLVSAKASSDDKVRDSKPYQAIMSLFQGSAMGGTLLSAEGTAWGLLNAVTEYVDHQAKCSTDNHRLASAWFGRGDDLKTNMFERVQALV